MIKTTPVLKYPPNTDIIYVTVRYVFSDLNLNQEENGKCQESLAVYGKIVEIYCENLHFFP